MIRFWLTKDGRWAVKGPISEVKVGYVHATTRGGQRKRVEVVSLGEPWDQGGERWVAGYLAPTWRERCAAALCGPGDPVVEECWECGAQYKESGCVEDSKMGCGRCA